MVWGMTMSLEEDGGDGNPKASGAAPPRADKPMLANQQWGGRFAGGPSAIMQQINASIGFDARLWRQDIRGSLAHAAMLARQGIIEADDEAAIRTGLQSIEAEI